MPYQKAEEYEFNLEDCGCPELWIKIKDPRTLSYKEQRRAQQAQFVLMRVQRSQGRYVPEPEEDFAITAMDQIVAKVLLDWNLPYPDDWEDEALRGTVIPLRDRVEVAEDGTRVVVQAREPDPLGVLPAPFLTVVVQEVGKRLVTPPKSPVRAGA